MKTLYSACLSRLGLTQSEAAALHEVRIDTVKSWCAGRNRVPPGAWIDLREHEAQIVELSEELREKWALAPAELHIHLRGRTANLMAVADFVLNAEDAAPELLSDFQSGKDAV